jgi:translation initiation factor IF-3
VKIGKGDFDTKTKKVEHFLGEGHKVKITIMFRGREVAHPELGMKILDNVAIQVQDLAKVEAAPKLDGRNMIMVLAPDKRAQDAAKRRAAEAAASGQVLVEVEDDSHIDDSHIDDTHDDDTHDDDTHDDDTHDEAMQAQEPATEPAPATEP